MKTRLIGVACAVALVACNRDAEEKPPKPLDAAAKAHMPGLPASMPSSLPTQALPKNTATVSVAPAWAKMPARFETRDGHKVVVAVGVAPEGNPSLSRTTAENRARVAIIRFLKNKADNEAVEGTLVGAHITKSETVNQQVFVEVEAPGDQ